MIVRQACEADLAQIAEVHVQCFPDNFSTQLGKHRKGYLQRRFYLEYMNDNPELFLVAEDETEQGKRIIGFCMGYYRTKTDHIKLFYKHNLFPIALRTLFLLLTFNKAAWGKLVGVFKKDEKFKPIGEEPVKIDQKTAGDLLSICVLSEFRGVGAAQALIERFEQVLKEQGKETCLLAVSTENGRGVRFYERNGYIGYLEKEGKTRAYVKFLK